MKRAWHIGLLAASAGLALTAAPVAAQSLEVQVRAVRRLPPVNTPAVPTRPVGTRQTVPLPEIVAELQSQPPYRNMNYIGVERFDSRTGLYALRFLNGRQVIVVLVDGRTGRVVNRGF